MTATATATTTATTALACKKRRRSFKGASEEAAPPPPVKRGRRPASNRSRQNSDSDDTSEHSACGSTGVGGAAAVAGFERRSPRPAKYNFCDIGKICSLALKRFSFKTTVYNTYIPVKSVKQHFRRKITTVVIFYYICQKMTFKWFFCHPYNDFLLFLSEC